MTTELRGHETASEIRRDAAHLAGRLRASGVVPTLAIVLATSDGGALWYSRAIANAAETEGIDCRLTTLSTDATDAEIADAIIGLAEDDGVHGIILQTPLPPGVSAHTLARMIPPEKDIDGMNPLSVGRLVLGHASFAPATAEAVLRLLQSNGSTLSGAHVSVIGRSAVVGKPVAQLLLREDATVTMCHSRTRSLREITACADIVVAAVGRPRFVTGDFIRRGATVIDVGTNAEPDGSLVGDVDEESVRGIADALTPVPGGVGPVTTATLLLHTVQAAQDAQPVS